MGAALAERIADVAVGFRYEDMPAEVRDKLRAHLLDTVGSAIVGATRPANMIVRDYALSESPEGPSTFIGARRRGRPEWVGLANGTLAHGFESDDTHIVAQLHPGAVTVPAALAIGEEVGASDADLLTAMALGYETAIRIGAAARDGIVHGRGMHPMSSVGPFGAAIVASKLRRLSAAQTAQALAIAGSHSSGTMEFTQGGGEVKRLHAGLANMAGIRSASLAAAGVTGPRSILEGKRGFYNAFSTGVDIEAVTSGFGRSWLLLDTEIKLYSACSLIHASLRALEGFISGDHLVADDVERVRCGVNREAMWAVGRIGPHPRNMQEAQFSLHYSVALALVRGGNDHEQYVTAEREGFNDHATRSLAERVEVELDPEADAAFPDAFYSRVTVARRNGPPLTRYTRAAGSRADPITIDQVREKFRRMTRTALPKQDAARIASVITQLPQSSSLRDVIPVLQTVTADGGADRAAAPTAGRSD